MANDTGTFLPEQEQSCMPDKSLIVLPGQVSTGSGCGY